MKRTSYIHQLPQQTQDTIRLNLELNGIDSDEIETVMNSSKLSDIEKLMNCKLC